MFVKPTAKFSDASVIDAVIFTMLTKIHILDDRKNWIYCRVGRAQINTNY